MNKDNFFIKEGYQTNPVMTFESSPGDYWTDARIETTRDFQYYVYQRAQSIFKANGFKTIADIGCGPAWKTKHFFSGVAQKVTLVDQPTLLEVVNRFFPEAEFNGLNLEEDSWVASQKQDMIICSDVIEHLANPTNLLKMIRENLNPEGIAIISTPERDYRRGKEIMHSPNKQHVREWNAAEMKAYLESEGFEVIRQEFDPQKIVSGSKYRLSRMLQSVYRRPTWSACQSAIVRLAK